MVTHLNYRHLSFKCCYWVILLEFHRKPFRFSSSGIFEVNSDTFSVDDWLHLTITFIFWIDFIRNGSRLLIFADKVLNFPHIGDIELDIFIGHDHSSIVKIPFRITVRATV